MRDKNFFFGDPLFDELDDFGGQSLGRYPVDIHVLEGVVDRFDLDLVELGDDFLALYEAILRARLTIEFLVVGRNLVVRVGQVSQGAKEEAEGNHKRVKVDL